MEKGRLLRCKIMVSHEKSHTGLKLVKVVNVLTNT